jgi:hypothetical protein
MSPLQKVLELQIGGTGRDIAHRAPPREMVLAAPGGRSI